LCLLSDAVYEQHTKVVLLGPSINRSLGGVVGVVCCWVVSNSHRPCPYFSDRGLTLQGWRHVPLGS
jgi:hypothetical protein